ncbi:MAG: holo-ACP synthase [Thiolinea sp.]
MKIVGIGTDIIEIARIARLLEGGNERFLQRVLHAGERARYDALNPALAAGWLAKRWATKEACAKALGTGIGQHAQLNEIETRHDVLGKPELVLHGVTLATAQRLGVSDLALSLADEYSHAVAFVVLTGAEERQT